MENAAGERLELYGLYQVCVGVSSPGGWEAREAYSIRSTKLYKENYDKVREKVYGVKPKPLEAGRSVGGAEWISQRRANRSSRIIDVYEIF